MNWLLRKLPKSLQDTLSLRFFGLVQIPMIGYLRPRVLELSESRCVVRIPLNRRSKNHLGSLYFGALAVGADCAGGLIAFEQVKRSGEPVSLVFKDFRADFLRRPTTDVDFVCEDGMAIGELVREAIRSCERVERTVTVCAYQAGDPEEPVAKMELTLSLKRRAQ